MKQKSSIRVCYFCRGSISNVELSNTPISNIPLSYLLRSRHFRKPTKVSVRSRFQPFNLSDTLFVTPNPSIHFSPLRHKYIFPFFSFSSFIKGKPELHGKRAHTHTHPGQGDLQGLSFYIYILAI